MAPSMFHRWQEQLFLNAAAALQGNRLPERNQESLFDEIRPHLYAEPRHQVARTLKLISHRQFHLAPRAPEVLFKFPNTEG